MKKWKIELKDFKKKDIHNNSVIYIGNRIYITRIKESGWRAEYYLTIRDHLIYSDGCLKQEDLTIHYTNLTNLNKDLRMIIENFENIHLVEKENWC